jgi:O-antigen/teichoic acid export membrane protein
MLPILSRLYTPEQFGAFGVFLSIVGITTVFASGKFELAIISEKNPTRRAALLILAITTSLVVLFLMLVLYVVALSFDLLQSLNIDLGVLIFCVIGLLATVTHDAVVNLKIAQEMVLPVARAKVIRVTATSVVQVLGYLLEITKLGLPAGEVAGRISALASIYKLEHKKLRQLRGVKLLTYLKMVATRNLEYPLKIAPSWTLNNASTLLLPAFIGWQYNLAVSGGFFLMYKIFSLPETAIVQSVNQSFMVEFKRHISCPGKQLEVFRRTAAVLFSLGIVVYPLLGLAFFFGVGVVFGDEWERYAMYGLLIIPYFIAQFTMSSLYVSLNILGEHSSQVLWDLSRSGSLVAMCFLVHYCDLHESYFIGLLSLLTFLSYAMLYFLIGSLLAKKCD